MGCYVCLFVCIEVKYLSQQFSVMSGWSHHFLGMNQYFARLMSVAQCHMVPEESDSGPLDLVSDDPPGSRSSRVAI